MGLDVRLIADQTAARADEVRPQAGALRLVGAALRHNRKALAGAIILGLFVVVAIIPGILAPYDPHAQIFEQTLPPSGTHLLGTTGNGQDIFSQLIWGTRERLAIAIVAAWIASHVLRLICTFSSFRVC